MGRKKSAQNCDILAWASAKLDCKEGRFIQLGNSFLLSPAVHDLSGTAFRLYVYMLVESGGKKEFKFPRQVMIKKYGLSVSSARNAIQELIEKGFIKITASGRTTREANEYEFCLTWKGIT
jgi:hypothetical protein